jgi:hypothetical protein
MTSKSVLTGRTTREVREREREKERERERKREQAKKESERGDSRRQIDKTRLSASLTDLSLSPHPLPDSLPLFKRTIYLQSTISSNNLFYFTGQNILTLADNTGNAAILHFLFLQEYCNIIAHPYK